MTTLIKYCLPLRLPRTGQRSMESRDPPAEICAELLSQGVFNPCLFVAVLPSHLSLPRHRSDVVQWVFPRISGPALDKQRSIYSTFAPWERATHSFRLGRSWSRRQHWVSLIPSPFHVRWRVYFARLSLDLSCFYISSSSATSSEDLDVQMASVTSFEEIPAPHSFLGSPHGVNNRWVECSFSF